MSTGDKSHAGGKGLRPSRAERPGNAGFTAGRRAVATEKASITRSGSRLRKQLIAKSSPRKQFRLQVPDQPKSAALRAVARDVLVDPETWFNTENLHLGGQKPIALIQKGEENLVYELLQGIKYGAFS